MAELAVGAAALGSAISLSYDLLLRSAVRAARTVSLLKNICSKLEEDLKIYRPYLTEIFQHIDCSLTSAPTAAREWEQAAIDFKLKLDKGRILLEDCRSLSIFHPLQRYRLGRSILRLRRDIRRFLQHDLQLFNSVIGIKQLDALNAVLTKPSEDDDEDRHARRLSDGIVNLVKEFMMGLVKNDANKNAALVMDAVRQIQDMMLTNAAVPSTTANSMNSAGSTPPPAQIEISRRSTLPPPQPFTVGLEDRIVELRSMLFSASDSKTVAIVGGMGGIGKTTLALALCRDPIVEEFFEKQIHFVTVSQSPDMVTLLSDIWKEVTGEKEAPHFQNVDDAYFRLQRRLVDHMKERSPLLLVLDDVWSKESLEKLTFHVDGLWTLVTTRQASMLETNQSQTYTLGLLDDNNSRRLFYYWTFGKDDIPEWADETLVDEVVKECKGLPLALKVIGGSLSSEAKSPHAWRRTREKLRQAEPLGEDQQNMLLGRLRTSVDALDQELRDCFMDLGAFPEDSECSVDNVLDIWVYVRGMEWDDAYCSLVELASRCLLSFDIQRFGQGRDHTTDYGCAGSLVFSQHDMMRDLAIQLGRENSPAADQWRWLLMPQQQLRVPEKWHAGSPAGAAAASAAGRPLAAQIVSINTGPMTKHDWPDLHIPHTEALLLYGDGPEYELPPFIRNVPELKVLIVNYSGGGVLRTGGAFQNLQGLRSLEITAKGEADTAEEGIMASMPKLSKMIIKCLKKELKGYVLSDVSASLEILKLDSLYIQKEIPIAKRLVQLEKTDHGGCRRTTSTFECLKVLEVQGCLNLRALPEDMGNAFKMLRCIGLWYCHYLETLPASICELKHLEVLQMLECMRLAELPTDLGHLTALQKLLLSGCKKLRELPDTIAQLSRLRLLDLSQCVNLRRLPQGVWQLPLLKTLDMSCCQSMEALGFPPEGSTVHVAPIREWSLTLCPLLETLPPGFGPRLPNLIKLSLKGCYELKTLPEDIGCLRDSLQELDLSGCYELAILPDQLVELERLESLNLSQCVNLTRLPLHIGRLRRLRRLYLEGATKLESLPESLAELPKLEALTMADCRSLTHLPAEIGRMHCLKELDLRGASKLTELPDGFGQLKRCLKVLRLDGCGRLKMPEGFDELVAELKRWGGREGTMGL